MLKGKSKEIKHCIFVLILVLIFVNSVKTKSSLSKISIENQIISCNKLENSNSLNSNLPLNMSDYLVTGDTGEVTDPTTVCTSENEIIILWREILWPEEIYYLHISKFASNLSVIINQKVVVNSSLITSPPNELSQPKLLIDSSDNLHLFWYIFKVEASPQIGDIYYQKLDSNLVSIISPKIVHTFTHWGVSNSANNIIKTILIDETDSIHLTVKDGAYLILDDMGEIKASTIIPVSLIEDFSIDAEGNALILCEELSGENTISVIKYTIGASNITEYCRNIVFDFTDKHAHNCRLLSINNTTYFYLNWLSWDGKNEYFESFILNSNGSVVGSGLLNKNFSEYVNNCLNSTHAVALDLYLSWDKPPKMYFSSYHPTSNLNYTTGKLLIQYLKNADYFYPPSIHYLRIIPDVTSQFILSWLINDGQNGFQVFLWTCNLNGTITAPLVVVAPELLYPPLNYTISYPSNSNSTEIISVSIFTFTNLILSATVTMSIVQRRKRKTDSIAKNIIE